ncbi:lysoplasmalogenase [Veronia nyctiphanis]|uniref:lysoplasmalogenase n=1 Tax=Veronia nyctiphanis TaxID=1278244 RepID=UPI002E26773B
MAVLPFQTLDYLVPNSHCLFSRRAGEYRNLILAGLAFSLLGDVCLMLPNEKFVGGLFSFLLAHLSYSLAFWQQNDAAIMLWLPFLIAAVAIIIFLLLLPNLGKLLVPIGLYIAVISQMAWASGQVWLGSQTEAAGLAFSGALLFVFSDAFLAFNKFKGPFRSSTLMVMGSYFLAQALITASVL